MFDRVKLKAVLQTARGPFLLLALLSGVQGWAMAHAQQVAMHWSLLLVALLAGFSGHVAVNVLNELHDHASGLDARTQRTAFSGGSGALPGLPSARAGAHALALVAVTVCVAAGLWLVWQAGPQLLLPGALGLALVFTYTPWLTRMPWACLLAPGLGFSAVIAAGTTLALGGVIGGAETVLLLSSGALISGLLLLNQFPDRRADASVGRRHFIIVYGERRGAWLFLCLLTLALLLPLSLLAQMPGLWLTQLAWLLALPVYRGVWREILKPANVSLSDASPTSAPRQSNLQGDAPQPSVRTLGANVLLTLSMPLLQALALLITARA